MGIGALTEFLKKSNKDFSQLSKASKKEIALLQLDIQGHENQTAHEISKLIMTLLHLRKKLDLVNKNKIRKVGIRNDKSSCYVDGKYCSSEIKRCEICYYPVCTSCSKIEERIVPPYKVRVCNSCKSRKRKRDEEKEKTEEVKIEVSKPETCYIAGNHCSSEIKSCRVCKQSVCTSCSKIEERIVPPFKIRICNKCESRKRKRDEEKEKEILAKAQ